MYDWRVVTDCNFDAVQHRVLDVPHGLAQLVGHGVQAGVNALVNEPAPSLSGLVTGRAAEPQTLPQRLRQYVNDTVAADDAALRQRELDYQQRTQGSFGGDVGGVVGSVLPYLAPTRALQALGTRVAGAVLPATRAAGVLGRAVSGATQGAVTAATQPVLGEDYLAGKTRQIGAGAALGGAVPIATSALSPVLGKAVNTARGVIDPAAKQLQELGDRFGARLSYGDITQKALPKKAEVALESVPVLGTGGFRAAQQAETKAAAEGLSERLQTQLKQTPFQHLAEVDAAAARGNKAAIELKQELANAGDDWNRIVQASGNLQAFRTRQQADRLYGEVERLAAGSGSIGVPQTAQAVRKALKEATAAKLPDKPTIKLLSELKESLVPSGTQPASNTYSAMRQLRSDLGDLITDYYKGSNALTGSKGVGILQQVRSAVESDMDGIFTRESMAAVTHIDESGVAKALGVVKDFRAAKGLGSFIPENARLAISWVRLAKDEKLDVHTHPISSLYVVCEGAGVLLGGDSDKLLNAGDVICIPPGCDHGFIGAGDDGYWGLSIQFAERGLYEDPSRPQVKFNDPYSLFDQLITDNELYAERFASNRIFDVLLTDELSPAVRSKFLDYLQILSDQFQKMVLLRSGVCDDPSFDEEFDSHLKEEFGHHHLLRNSRTDLVARSDAPFEALCIWFNHQMLVLDNVEKLVLVHLVVEASAHVFYSKIKKVFDSSKLSHFDEHAEHDHDHESVKRAFFKNMTTAQFNRIREVQKQGWSVVEKQYQRLAEIIVE